MELSPKRASRFETNNIIQESAAVESVGKDLVAASDNLNTRDLVADDLLEETLTAITGESIPLIIVNLGESRRISLIHDLPMPPGYKVHDPGSGDSLPSSSSSLSSQVEKGDDTET